MMTIAQYKEAFPGARFAYHPPEQAEKIRANHSRSEKIRQKKIDYWATHKGQTLEQLRGIESATRTKALLSKKMSGELNPAFGKVYPGVGRNLGKYKGVLFRSLYEYSYLKFLEAIGKNLATDISYEQYVVPFNFNGVSRTYHPDFEVSEIGIVEVKSVYETTVGPQFELNIAKFEAAIPFFKNLGKTFTVLTERDFPVFTKIQAKMDPIVEWLRP